MKTQSFEYQLRHAVAPTPDPQARLRARRAALAEFERIHVESGTPRTAASAGVRRFFHIPTSWGRRNTLVGAVASACVVVIAASVFLLLPPGQREAPSREPPVMSRLAPDHPEGAGRGSPLPTQSGQSGEPRQMPGAAREAHAAQGVPPAQGAAPAQERQAAGESQAPREPQASAVTQAAGKPRANGEPQAGEADERSLVARDQRAENERQATHQLKSSPSRVAHAEHAPPALAQPSLPAKPTTSTAAAATASLERSSRTADLNEIVVTEARVASSAQASASAPITMTEDPKLLNAPAPASPPAPAASPSSQVENVIVTGARAKRSWLQGLFARNNPGPAVAGAPLPSPASKGRDKFQHFEVNPVKRVADEPVSTFSADVDTVSYSFVRRQLNEGVLPQVDAVRAEEMINYFDYGWPTSESRDQPFRPTVTVSDSPWGQGKKLIHIGIKGYELPVRQQPDINLVMLLDVSGSMDQPDKLPLAQRSMALLLDTLKPTDTVGIVVYAGAAGEVLAPTPVKDKETILRALNSLQPGGSTAGAEGIRLAYELAEKNFRKDGVNRILLATDGDFNVGITDSNELKGFVEREREKGIFLSFLGFGEGNYHDDMGQVLAQNGNGVAAYIDTLSEARKVLVQESTASLFTIAKDVKLQVEFNPATVAEYRLVGYETRALNREDFNNDKVDAGDIGSGHAVTAIYEITPVGSKAKLIDERRYAEHEVATDQAGKASEYGFLRIRYKLPNASESRLLEQPIRIDAGVPPTLEHDVDFSTAVAGFAQLLRGGKYTGALTFKDVARQAQGALGADPFGYRAEFVQLVHKAQHAKGM
jgi:Ca-activated chloride channel homolog